MLGRKLTAGEGIIVGVCMAAASWASLTFMEMYRLSDNEAASTPAAKELRACLDREIADIKARLSEREHPRGQP